MLPLDMAMKLVGASNKCEKHKCPFMSQCKGNYETCTMKGIALMLRSQNAEIDSLQSLCKAYANIVATTQTYIAELEKINRRYHDLVLAFEHGYRPKPKPGSKTRKRIPKIKKELTEMDGDERYAYTPPPANEPAPPLVVI